MFFFITLCSFVFVVSILYTFKPHDENDNDMGVLIIAPQRYLLAQHKDAHAKNFSRVLEELITMHEIKEMAREDNPLTCRESLSSPVSEVEMMEKMVSDAYSMTQH